MKQHHSNVASIGTVLVAAGFMTATVQAANLVANGSFETPGAPANLYTTTTPTSWSAVGSSVDIIAAGYSGGVPSDGSQFVDLIGGLPAWTFPTGIQQTILLDGGVTYELSFDYSGDNVATNPLLVEFGTLLPDPTSLSITGLNAFSDFGTVTPWGHFSTTVTPPISGSYLLQFTTAGGANGGPYLDNVVVQAISEVPEASSLVAAAGAGLAMLGHIVRRRNARR